MLCQEKKLESPLAGLCCGSRLRKGEVFAYVGLPQNLKDLKENESGLAKSFRMTISTGELPDQDTLWYKSTSE